VGLRTGLDTEARGKILCLCRKSKPDHPACSQTLTACTNPPPLLVQNIYIIRSFAHDQGLIFVGLGGKNVADCFWAAMPCGIVRTMFRKIVSPPSSGWIQR
jgi:hypothetical protein